MYQVSVEQHFDAAHYLRGYRGKCESLHGHRFRVIVGIECPQLDDIGLAYDFTELKKQLDKILGRFDHVCLNEIEPFTAINPSSENIARTIYEELIENVTEVVIARVEVLESPDSKAAFIPS